MKLFFLAASLLVLSSLATEATAARITCQDPIDNRARVGWPDRLELALAEDFDDRECRFSIAGFAAGSPPQDQLDAARQAIRSVSVFDGRIPINVLEAVPLLLAAASPFDQPDPDLINDEFLASVAECFSIASFIPLDGFTLGFEVIDGTEGGLSSFGVTCAAATPGVEDDLSAFLGPSIVVEDLRSPQLVIRNQRSGDLVEILFLPIPFGN